MRSHLVLAVLATAVLAAPVAVQAGSIERGAKAGTAYGKRVAGPVGAPVGAVMGGSAYGFRSGASKVIGVPEETGSVRRPRASQKRIGTR
jgi:hypothetical protein